MPANDDDSELSPSRRPSRAIWIVAFWLAVAAVRIGAVWALSPSLATDPDAYVALAESWCRTGTYGLADADGQARPTAFRPPVYPAILALTSTGGRISSWQIAFLNVAMGLATVGGAVAWGRAIGQPRVGWIAGAAVAVDPSLLYQSAQPMTETPAACVAVWAIASFAWASRRNGVWRYAVPGVLLGIACLTRPTFLPVAIAWSAYLLALAVVGYRFEQAPVAEVHSSARGRRALGALVFVAVVAAFVGAWTLRNAIELGSPVVATTHGGYTLLLGNNEDFYRWLKDRGDRQIWTADELQRRLAAERPAEGESEVEEDRRLSQRAREWIAANPTAFVECCLYRVGRFWSPLPATFAAEPSPLRRGLALANGAWYVGVYLLAAVGLYAARRRALGPDFAPALLLVGAFVAVHAVYWTDVRMRAPAMPAILFAAALGASTGYDLVRRRCD